MKIMTFVWSPTSCWEPFGPLAFFLHALWDSGRVTQADNQSWLSSKFELFWSYLKFQKGLNIPKILQKRINFPKILQKYELSWCQYCARIRIFQRHVFQTISPDISKYISWKLLKSDVSKYISLEAFKVWYGLVERWKVHQLSVLNLILISL